KISLLIVLAFFAGCNKKADPKAGSASNSPQTPVVMEAGGEVDPDAIPEAVPGGVLNLWGGPAPKTLNAMLDYNFLTKELFGLLFDGLAGLHPQENRPVGVLAESWSLSPDSMTYTFKLNPLAKWSDGKAITAEDVQFYYDVVMNPKNMTSLFRVGL